MPKVIYLLKFSRKYIIVHSKPVFIIIFTCFIYFVFHFSNTYFVKKLIIFLLRFGIYTPLTDREATGQTDNEDLVIGFRWHPWPFGYGTLNKNTQLEISKLEGNFIFFPMKNSMDTYCVEFDKAGSACVSHNLTLTKSSVIL